MNSNHSIALTLAEIADRLGGRLNGPADLTIRGVGSIDACGPGEITFLDNPKYLSKLKDCRAEAIVLAHDLDLDRDLPNVRVDQPQIAFAKLLEFFRPRRRDRIGVSARAHVADDAHIGEGSNVHPGAYVGAGASIGDDTDIYPGAYVGPEVRIGSGCTLYPNVVVYEGCELGDRVILHSGVVIGADGYGYVQERQDDPQEPIVHRKVPQVGRVVIEDDVEIGANSTVDRAAIDTTRIARGTKIDNLVMIAHNCEVGRHSLIVAQVGISGSTRIGDYVTLGGQVGIIGHLEIGDRVQIAAQAGIVRDIPEGTTVWGTPALEIGRARRVYATLERLPELRQQLRALQRRVDALESDESA